MRTIYLECNMGAAGDMLTAALLELVPDQEQVVKKLNHLGLPKVRAWAEKSEKCGITGTHMRVEIGGEEEKSLDVKDGTEKGAEAITDSPAERGKAILSSDEHHHHHEGHHHHHASLADVEHYIQNMDLPDEVKDDIRNVYHLIAEAEGYAHGMPVEQIHFHEVGTLDAIFDVTAVCYLMHLLHPDQVIASPIRTGFGEVRCAHGIMPVPTPATAYLLQGIPTYAGDIRGEMCTPTGAALLKYYAKQFVYQPAMRVEKTGYGMGTKDFPAANCVRAFLGETEGSLVDKTQDSNLSSEMRMEDQILELRANIDDMTGEEIGFAMGKLFDAGARDVFTTAIGMKKNRPGILLTVICMPSEKEKMVHTIFQYTTTIGIRETICRRNILKREEKEISTPYGKVRVKTSSGYGVTRQKAEYDDLKKIADEQGLTLGEAGRRALGENF